MTEESFCNRCGEYIVGSYGTMYLVDPSTKPHILCRDCFDMVVDVLTHHSITTFDTREE